MRFTVAWSDVLSQNAVLKLILCTLTALSLLLGGGLILLSQKDPLIIERACYSGIVAPKTTEHTNGEVNAFVTEALSQRFDSKFESLPTFLSPEEKAKAQKDREEVVAKKIRQKVIVNNIEIKADKISVDADRLISVEQVRTAFRFPLEVKVATVTRSERNPYGLMLVSVLEITSQGK